MKLFKKNQEFITFSYTLFKLKTPPKYAPPPPSQPKKPKEFFRPRTPSLRLWKEPSKKSKLLTRIRAKDIFEVIEKIKIKTKRKENIWYRVLYKGKEGFVESNWTKPAKQQDYTSKEKKELQKTKPKKPE